MTLFLIFSFQKILIYVFLALVGCLWLYSCQIKTHIIVTFFLLAVFCIGGSTIRTEIPPGKSAAGVIYLGEKAFQVK